VKNRFSKLILPVAAVALALPVFLQASVPGSAAIDVGAKVRHELLMLPYYSIFDDLKYQVDGSAVTLSGAVVRPTLKSDAGRVVARIAGVSRVVNNIEVLPLSPFDNRIRLSAYRAIYGYGALQRYALGALPSIHIIVDNGHLTLEGVVANETDRNLANIRANGVFGVFSVQNNLKVESKHGEG
jgi:hyperosmotically inducible protein